MRIAVSFLNFRPGHVGGVETCLRRLLRWLPELKGDDEIVAVGHEGNAAALNVSEIERVIVPKGDRAIVMTRCLEAFSPYRARFAERAFEGIEPDVVYFPQQSIFPKRIGAPCVVQAVDVQHVLMPKHFSLFARAFRKAIYPYSLAKAARVIAISEWTRRTLVERCDVSGDKVDVVPLGSPNGRREDIEPYGEVDGQYLYYPAATFPHKGHATLLRAFAALRERDGFDYKLVLTGEQTGHWRALVKLMAALRIEGDVVHLGFVPYERVLQVYTGAAAVVFPTEFEGFGLPVIEAAALGKRVIASRLDVFDEIGLPKRFQIDFRNPDELRRALREPEGAMLEKEPSTWREAVGATLEVLRRVAKKR